MQENTRDIFNKRYEWKKINLSFTPEPQGESVLQEKKNVLI